MQQRPWEENEQERRSKPRERLKERQRQQDRTEPNQTQPGGQAERRYFIAKLNFPRAFFFVIYDSYDGYLAASWSPPSMTALPVLPVSCRRRTAPADGSGRSTCPTSRSTSRSAPGEEGDRGRACPTTEASLHQSICRGRRICFGKKTESRAGERSHGITRLHRTLRAMSRLSRA